MNTAIVPSNQTGNPYKGLPGVGESKWARAVADWVYKTLRDHGHEATIHWEESSDQLGALRRMVNAAIATKPDAVLSIHSDAVGDAKQTGVLALVPDMASVGWGTVFARECGRRIGLPYRGVWVFGEQARRIIFLSRLRETGTRGLLAEIGEHATVAEAAWNWRHIKEIGVGIAEAWLVSLGIELEADMTPEQAQQLQDLTTEVAKLRDSARASSHRETQMVTLLQSINDKLDTLPGIDLSEYQVLLVKKT